MNSEAATEEMCCANCGISAIDNVKLKYCDGGCDLVKYCSDGCQENQKDQHGEECRKRLIEIRDRNLFTVPEGSHCHWGECPICCLPLPLEGPKSTFMGCCSKLICNGCDHANQIREIKAGLKQRCAFCRELMPKTAEECYKRCMKRIKKNDPVAMSYMGRGCIDEGDYETALEYFKKSAEMGDPDAHYNLSIMYHKGDGVEKDMKKEIYHLEEATIGGHPDARHNLGCEEAMNGNFERARKHFIIAANLGYHDSLKMVLRLHTMGHASKEDYANALRTYQAAVDETKSSEREEAELFDKFQEAAQQS